MPLKLLFCLVSMISAVSTASLLLTAKAFGLGWERPSAVDHKNLSDQAFMVHYAPEFTPQQAQQALTTLNESHSYFKQLGFPEPPKDKDGKFDAYFLSPSYTWFGRNDRGGSVIEGIFGEAASSYFFVYPGYETPVMIAHEYFHSFQQGLDYAEVTAPSGWWAEQTANWAGASFMAKLKTQKPAAVNFRGSMICEDQPLQGCYDGSYTYWPFSEYLASRYGDRIIAEIWLKQQHLGRGRITSHARESLEAVLASRGTSLKAEFEEFTKNSILMDYGIFKGTDLRPTLQGLLTNQIHQLQLAPWSATYLAFAPLHPGLKLEVKGLKAHQVGIRVRDQQAFRKWPVENTPEGSRAVFPVKRRISEIQLSLSNAHDSEQALEVTVAENSSYQQPVKLKKRKPKKRKPKPRRKARSHIGLILESANPLNNYNSQSKALKNKLA